MEGYWTRLQAYLERQPWWTKISSSPRIYQGVLELEEETLQETIRIQPGAPPEVFLDAVKKVARFENCSPQEILEEIGEDDG